MTDVSRHAVRGFRMRRQHLIERAPAGNLLEGVEAVHGIQAQISAHAQFAVAQRIEKCRPPEIDRALWQEKSLIKTWAMRGTVHWLPATEEPLFVSGMRVVRLPSIDRWWRNEGITPEQVEQFHAAVLEALGNGPMSRQEVAAAVVPEIGGWAEPYLLSSWGSGFKRMCQAGLIVFGPSRGTNVTFARRDSWTPHDEWADGDAALRELIRRYIRSFGPVTVQDAAYWLGATIRDIQAAWDGLLPELAPIRVDEQERWLLAGDIDDLTAMEGAQLPVRLVPAFDPLLLAHREKTDLLPETLRKRIYAAAAWVYPAVLVGGAIAGKWQYERKSKQMIVTVEPFQKLTKTTQRKIEREANYLAKLTGRIAEVRYAE
jgi:winged helix DNA-binding protein